MRTKNTEFKDWIQFYNSEYEKRRKEALKAKFSWVDHIVGLAYFETLIS